MSVVSVCSDEHNGPELWAQSVELGHLGQTLIKKSLGFFYYKSHRFSVLLVLNIKGQGLKVPTFWWLLHQNPFVLNTNMINKKSSFSCFSCFFCFAGFFFVFVYQNKNYCLDLLPTISNFCHFAFFIIFLRG